MKKFLCSAFPWSIQSDSNMQKGFQHSLPKLWTLMSKCLIVFNGSLKVMVSSSAEHWIPFEERLPTESDHTVSFRTTRRQSYQIIFLRKRRIFPFFITKLGSCTVHTFFSYQQTLKLNSENCKTGKWKFGRIDSSSIVWMKKIYFFENQLKMNFT